MTTYEQQDFDGEKKLCDLIMKGGITSGVVFPLAIVELAKEHIFRNVGGASAGAIAAGITAAAEYDRAGGGFCRLAELPDELSERLQSLFQPAPRYRGAFGAFLVYMGDESRWAKARKIPAALLANHPFAALLGLLPSIAFALLGYLRGDLLMGLLVVLVFLMLVPTSVAVAIVLNIFRGIPATFFGICPGVGQPRHDQPGLTDWLANKIEEMAGRMVGDTPPPTMPLTFGMLKEKKITLQVMTTNLSVGRPYTLPTNVGYYYFKKSEFDQLFPAWIVNYLVGLSTSRIEDYYPFPSADDLPVIVAVRMSLSFPVLLSAVPLYRRDYSYRLDRDEREKLRACWFSDGGISSNFPIHFFDTLLPTRPTFGLTLEPFHAQRHGDPNSPSERVYLPFRPGTGMQLPVQNISSLGGFAMSVLNTAKDWQDTLQSVLPGYRERIAHIALQEDEGGINLTMPAQKINRLVGYGQIAGEKLNGFDMDEHRWRRLLVALSRLEDSLDDFAEAYDSEYRQFLLDYPPQAKSYNRFTQEWLAEVNRFAERLRASLPDQRSATIRQGPIPKPDTDLRITPKFDSNADD